MSTPATTLFAKFQDRHAIPKGTAISELSEDLANRWEEFRAGHQEGCIDAGPDMPPSAVPAAMLDFIREQLLELRKVSPGYVSFKAEGYMINDSPTAAFHAYNEHVGHYTGSHPAPLVHKIREAATGRTEAEMLRNKAAQLLKEAETLESKSQPAAVG